MPLLLGHDRDVPLQVHGRYSRGEVLAAFGHSPLGDPSEWREGVRFERAAQVDLFAVTLRKAERDFSPSTMYRDYAIGRDLFYWESQSTLTERAPTAQRYIAHAARGSDVVLLVRPTKDDRAFICLGRARYVRHDGERPIAFVWRLDVPMPEWVFAAARTEVA